MESEAVSEPEPIGFLRGARQHVTDSAAFLVVTTPVNALAEKIAGMKDHVSLNSRLMVAGLFFLGLGGAIGYLRDKSREHFNITERTRELYQHIHDMTHIAVTTAVVNPCVYLIAGSRDAEEIVISTGLATLIGFFIGGAMGYSADAFRDLTGYEPSERIPERLRNARPGIKKLVAAGALAASISLTALIYDIMPDKEEPPQPTTQITTQYEPRVLEQYAR